jgi:tRNA A37 threonylcarbamoyladenosine synthetase subunit TsaC/SUA5/YrdC
VTSLHNEDDHIQEYFADPYSIYEKYGEQVNLIIDGGYGKLEASTIVDCTSGAPEIIRQGVGELM